MRKAIVFVCGGESYCTDAIESANSYKRNNPGLTCILATDFTGGVDSVFDRVVRLPPRQYPSLWYLDSCRYYNLAFNTLYKDYDALCFSDSDCYCDGSLDDMFPLADRFDISVVHGVTRQTTDTLTEIPNSFPEFEIGVMLVACNEHVHNLFVDWLELYEKNPGVYKNNDQGPLREALWINKLVNMYVLPEEYHARWGFGVCVVGRVRILHSRSCGDNPHTNAMAAAEINAIGGRRLFNSEGIQGKPVASGR
jgi:hypothetical protein